MGAPVNSTELIEAVRQEVFIDQANFEDFGDARILLELSDELRTTFSRAVTQARSGYWLKQKQVPVVPGVAKYPIPRRAVIGGLENVSIAAVGGKFYKLQEVTETHTQDYEMAPGHTGQVVKYAVRADQVVLLPTPAQDYTLRLSYYLRPSQLLPTQIEGRIISVDPDARTVELETISAPLNQITATAIADGDLVDVVHPSGWCEVALVGAPVLSVFGSTITLGGDDPMDEIVEGDYVRAAEQTDWPCLPEDFHRTLAKSAAVKCMSQMHMFQKADATAGQVNGDLARFSDLLVSRVKSEAPVLKAPRSILQAGRTQRGFYGWRG